MADTNNDPIMSDETVDGALRREVLISLIVDREGDGSAWVEFSRLAADDATAWRELARAQRDHAALSHAVALEIAPVESVELPAHSEVAGVPLSYRLSRWSGWAAAAAVAITWLGTQFAAVYDSRNASLRDNTSTAGLLPAGAFNLDSPQDALDAYKQLGQQSGTVLGELPERVIVESRPLAGGRGFEVVFIRQIMERAQVPELYQLTRDDSGQQGLLLPVSQHTVKKNNRID